jgi:hypothetical protein
MTPEGIATWMLAELNRDGILDQAWAAHEIESQFGDEYTPLNMKSGNLSIRHDVLVAFRRISKETVVWERGERRWRRRERGDVLSRRQN